MNWRMPVRAAGWLVMLLIGWSAPVLAETPIKNPTGSLVNLYATA